MARPMGGPLLFLLGTAAALAQAALPQGAAGAPAGRGQEPAGRRAPSREPGPEMPPASAAALAPGAGAGGTFRLAKVAFSPSHFLSPAELDRIAAPYLDRPIGFDDVHALVAALNRVYDSRGIVTARAVLPPQPIDGGTLRIDLIEGRLGTLRAAGNAYVRDAYLLRQAHLAPGDTIDPEALRASLQRFNRRSDVQLRASLSPGAAPGFTDIELAATEPRRDILTLFVDNHAYAATGTYEGGALFRHTGLLGLDDRLSGLVTVSRGALTGTASYDAPLGYAGTRVGLSYGHGLTRGIAGAYAGFGSKGIADSLTGEIVQPLWSDDRWTALGSASGGYTRTRNSLGGVFLGSTGTAKGTLGFALAYRSQARAFDLAASGTFAHGEIDNGARRSGYALLSGSVGLSQIVHGPVSLSANGAWQWASASGLPSDLLLQIGGPTTVRGYTQGALAGDKGYYVEGQLNLALPRFRAIDATLYGFADRGHVTASFVQPNGLTSVGVGLTARLGPRLGFEANIGHPLKNRDLGPGAVHAYARLTWDLF